MQTSGTFPALSTPRSTRGGHKAAPKTPMPKPPAPKGPSKTGHGGRRGC